MWGFSFYGIITHTKGDSLSPILKVTHIGSVEN